MVARQSKLACWPTLLAAISLACLVCAVFWPILDFDFVNLDVPVVVEGNPYIRGLTAENLKHIFTSRRLTSYYPVRTLTFAIDYQFWGLDPTGFELTNGLIHLANVLLVFWLILRLLRRAALAVPVPARGMTRPADAPLDAMGRVEAAPGLAEPVAHAAALAEPAARAPALAEPVAHWRGALAAGVAAGVFAVHPVVVEPVTWVAGREELLMTLGALGCLHFHLTARRLGEQRGGNWRTLAGHACAALCCAAACLSNAVGAVIPVLVVALDVLTLARPRLWRIARGSSVLWAIGLATIAGKWVCDRTAAPVWAAGPLPALVRRLGLTLDVRAKQVDFFSVERMMLVLNAYWLNLRTLFWPRNLAISYSLLRPKSFLDREVIFGAAAIVLTLVVVWLLRRRKSALLGLVWFGVALAPISQIMPHHIHRADRFLYLPLAGLAAAIAAGLMALARAGKGLAAAGALGLLLLGLLSARQVWTWRNSCTVWAHCVQAQPDNSAAQEAFAELLAAHGDPRRAMIHYRRAVELDFNDPEMLRVRALQCASREDDPTRNYQEALQLATRACELAHWRNPTCLRALAAIHTILGGFLAESGEFRGAMEHYRRAMEMDTEFDAPLYNLASLLANCPDENLRRPEEAVRLARQACELTKQPSANHLKILAQAYAAAGRFDMAAAKAQEGADRAQDAGDSQAADELRKWANQYRSPIRKK